MILQVGNTVQTCSEFGTHDQASIDSVLSLRKGRFTILVHFPYGVMVCLQKMSIRDTFCLPWNRSFEMLVTRWIALVVVGLCIITSCLAQPARPPNEQQFSDILESIFEMIREVTRSVTTLVTDVTDALGINTEDGGIGGVIGGALNLISVGADIATGVASHIIGGGDLFGGLIPVLG